MLSGEKRKTNDGNFWVHYFKKDYCNVNILDRFLFFSFLAGRAEFAVVVAGSYTPHQWWTKYLSQSTDRSNITPTKVKALSN